MKIVVLASGSKGNVIYVETKKHKILFDMGMNVKYIKNKLLEINVDLSDIDSVFITHDHSDHVSALPVFIKNYSSKIYISLSMMKGIKNLHDYEHVVIYEDEIELKDIKIEVIKTSHDAVDSRGFVITSGEESAVYLTDTGYIHYKNFEKLTNKNYYLFESNYDVEKLIDGHYPMWVKQRVLSNHGHLSNKDSSIYLTKFIGDKTKKIVLMHLSENNNTEDLALSTLKQTLADNNIEFDDVACAKQREIYEVKS